MPRPFKKDLQVRTFPKDSEIKNLRRQCERVSNDWACEVGILYGYKGDKRSLQINVWKGFRKVLSAAHTHRVMEVARYYVEHRTEAIRKIRKMVKDSPELYQFR